MKITNPPAPPPKPQSAAKSQARRDGAPAEGPQGPGAAGDLQGRDFASVLDDTAHAHQEEGQRETGEAEGRGADDDAPTFAERPARRREVRRGAEADEGPEASRPGGALLSQGAARESAPRAAEMTNVRAILHIADLEKLVAAVRTQVLPNGGGEVMLVLHRSVLDGLRVRLSADNAGRVSAEFIASTEKVRAQVEARSAELSDLLRSRGVALSGLRTSVGSGAGHDSPGGRREGRPFNVSPTPHADGSSPSGASAGEPAEGAGDADHEGGSTYRA